MSVKIIISFVIGLLAAVFAVINHAQLWLGIVIFVLVSLLAYAVMMLIRYALNKTLPHKPDKAEDEKNNRIF